MKKAIIYGMGEKYELLVKSDYFQRKIEYEIVAVTDKNPPHKEGEVYPFIERNSIGELSFDYIIVSSKKYYETIKKELITEYGYEEDMIILLDGLLASYYFQEFQGGLFTQKNGVEVGGPSDIFSAIYSTVNSCDGINFSRQTVWWSGEKSYLYGDNKKGRMIVNDVTNLKNIENEKYEFCISSNNLEHVANPIKALKEMKRVTCVGGVLLLVVPMKSKCFDHNREYTMFRHLLDDYERDVREDDLSHLSEIMQLHDFHMDKACGGKVAFEKRAKNNIENRCLHHHVFDLKLLQQLYEYLNINIISMGELCTDFYIVGQKS